MSSPGAPQSTTAIMALDFDIDTHTGFMPCQPPVARLPLEWEPWESTLEKAIRQKLRHGTTQNLAEDEREKSEVWRNQARNMPILQITSLTTSEIYSRRAHHVLVYILHFYVHTHPPTSPIYIPPPITLPLLQISNHLQLPPVLTHADTVLYNWDRISNSGSDAPRPALSNLKLQTSFTGTEAEAEFLLTPTRIEFKGADALNVMQDITNEVIVGGGVAVDRVAAHLRTLAGIVRELRAILLDAKKRCDPDVFYNKVRPWFSGVNTPGQSTESIKATGDGISGGPYWVFEGIEQDSSLSLPQNISGPSAAQSTLMHALDIFLGVDQYSEPRPVVSSMNGSAAPELEKAQDGQPHSGPSFMRRMQACMPRPHREFLEYLSAQPLPLRAFVEEHSAFTDNGDGPALKDAFNDALLALKEVRDAHMQVVALLIIVPAAKARREKGEQGTEEERPGLKGTGGTSLVNFLKGTRERNKEAMLG